MKKWRKFGLSLLVVALALSFCLMPAFAQEEELIRTEAIRSEPISVMRYVSSGADYVWEIFSRLLESGKPVLIFNGEPEGGLSATFIENSPKENFNLVGGWTILDDQPTKFFWGFEYEVAMAEGTIFQKLRPAIYLCEGKVVAGFGFELSAG